MTDIQQCDASVTAIGPDAPVESVVETICLIDGMMSRIKDLKAQLESRAVEWIKANGEFAIGDVRYYVGTPKVTKCRDVRGAVESVLELTGGDLGRLVDCLASGALKHGTVRKLMDELGATARFDELFDVTYDEALKEGKLQKADVKFLKVG